jgi:hypothetical protein
MWLNGVSVVTWLSLRDNGSPAESLLQAGFYTHGKTISDDVKKPYLEGYRFPVVAYRRGGGVYVWGRTPSGQRTNVVIQLSRGGRWTVLGTLRPNRFGIFQATFHRQASATQEVRARLGTAKGEASLAFSLRRVPDHFYNPFGSIYRQEPKKP